MLKLQYFGHLMQRADSLEKTLILGKMEGGEGMTEDEMVGWHHQLNGHEFEQASGDGEGQGSLACCNLWGHKELDRTEQLNDTDCSLPGSSVHGISQARVLEWFAIASSRGSS